MNNILSNCGLVDARINASEKDLPVQRTIFNLIFFFRQRSFCESLERLVCLDQ